MDFDFFRVREYSLIPDSGGGGAFRGGLGIRRRYETLADEVQYAQYGDRFRFQPDGRSAASPGPPPRATSSAAARSPSFRRSVTTRSTLTRSHTLASAVRPIFCESAGTVVDIAWRMVARAMLAVSTS